MYLSPINGLTNLTALVAINIACLTALKTVAAKLKKNFNR